MDRGSRIWVVHATTGRGHQRAGEAVVGALGSLGHAARLVDLFDSLAAPVAAAYRRGYRSLVSIGAPFYRWAYSSWDRDGHGRDNAFVRLTTRLASGFLDRLLEERPDLVIGTHFLACQLAAGAIRDRRWDGALWQVITDYAPHRLQVMPEVERYFVATSGARRKISDLGIPRAAIEVSGIPCGAEFQPRPMAEADGHTAADAQVLFLGHGLTRSQLRRWVRGLAAHPPRRLLVAGVESGRLRTDLALQASRSRHPFQVLGFVDDVSTLMRQADLILCKAGGLTCSEAMACGAPLAFCCCYPGQEEENREILVAAGAAVDLDRPEQVAALATDRDRLQRMRRVARDLARRDAAHTIAAAAIDRVAAGAGGPPQPHRTGQRLNTGDLPHRPRVVLVRPSYSAVYHLFGRLPRQREVRPPLGLLSIAASLRRAGYPVQVVDGEPRLLDPTALVREVLALDPEVVGISATTPEIHLAAELAHLLREARPELLLVLGGPHASAIPEQALEQIPELDYVVVGEGEVALVELLESRPADPVVVADSIADLDSLPLPARDLVRPEHYRYVEPGKGMVTLDAVETSRGCPFQCSFCFHLPGNGTRFKSPERVIEELRESQRVVGAKMVLFFDDTFTLDQRRAGEVLDRIVASDIRLGLHCFTRADTISPDLAAGMRRAGFVKVTMGVESGRQEVLDRLGKGTKLQDYRDAYSWLHAAGIETRGSFIVGNPHETWETIRDSIAFARELDLFRVGVNIATPYPGTRLYELARQGDGIELVSSDWSRFCRWGVSVVRTPAMSAAEIERAQRVFVTEFYSSPKVLRYHARQLAMGNRSLYYHRPVLWSVWGKLTGAGLRSKAS